MSAAKGQGNTLGVAVVIAVVVVGLVVFGAARIRLGKKGGDAKQSKTPNPTLVVTRVDSDSALHLEVELYDPKPLFLPTAINNSDPALPSGMRREPGSVFKPIPPRLTFAEYEMKVVMPDPIVVPASPYQAVRVGEEPVPFHGLGYINYPFSPLSARLAFLEVAQADSGKVVLAMPLQATGSQAFPSVEWKPLEMVVAVEASGLVGDPVITSGSDSEEVDSYFRNLLVKDLHLGVRLAPGFYTLCIGP